VGGILGAGAVAAALLAGYLWWGGPPDPVAGPSGTRSPSGLAAPGTSVPALPGTIVVHVSGAVARPGVVSLPSGARVADAVAAAGGVDRSADITAVNLAAPLADGDQVVVPQAAGTAGGGSDMAGSPAVAGAAGATGDKVALNLAGQAELETLPGVGPVIASRIVAHREANGPFQAVEDLLDVPGIGEATLAGFRDLVVVP
jgi:competence protein ComEA